MFNPTTIDQFILDMRLWGGSPNTIRAYGTDLRTLHAAIGDQEVSDRKTFEGTIADFLNATRDIVAAATTKRRLAAYRAFGNWYVGVHLDPTHTTGFLGAYKAPSPAKGTPHPLQGGVDDVILMYVSCYKPEHQALVLLMGLLGLRVSEARAVTLGHFDDSTGELLLLVRGKGSKLRWVPVLPNVAALLDRAMVAAGKREDGRLVPLADRSARQAWTMIGERAGVQPTATHDGRMTFGTTVYANTKDLRVTQELLGHASSVTTEGYTGISEAAKREAVKLL